MENNFKSNILIPSSRTKTAASSSPPSVIFITVPVSVVSISQIPWFSYLSCIWFQIHPVFLSILPNDISSISNSFSIPVISPRVSAIPRTFLVSFSITSKISWACSRFSNFPGWIFQCPWKGVAGRILRTGQCVRCRNRRSCCNSNWWVSVFLIIGCRGNLSRK